jgi:hypothetical protein
MNRLTNVPGWYTCTLSFYKTVEEIKNFCEYNHASFALRR